MPLHQKPGSSLDPVMAALVGHAVLPCLFVTAASSYDETVSCGRRPAQEWPLQRASQIKNRPDIGDGGAKPRGGSGMLCVGIWGFDGGAEARRWHYWRFHHPSPKRTARSD